MTLAQCAECGRDFQTNLPLMEAVLCPPCDEADRRAHEAAYREARADADQEPPPWSREAMRERLGVTGDVDE